jgi:S1-C subfamily serine protease
VKEKEGVLLAQVHQGTGAEKAGLVSGDIIKSVDDKAIKNTNELIKEIQKKKVGQKVKLSVVREGKPMTVEVTTTAMPEKPEGVQEKEVEEKLGARVQELTPPLASRYRISSEIKRGVVIIGVEEGSPAQDIGLQEGDVILEINRKKIETIKDFEKAIKEISLEKGIVFRLHRRGNTFYHSFKKQP